jgi:ActR/RegA family two-component response regulator
MKRRRNAQRSSPACRRNPPQREKNVFTPRVIYYPVARKLPGFALENWDEPQRKVRKSPTPTVGAPSNGHERRVAGLLQNISRTMTSTIIVVDPRPAVTAAASGALRNAGYNAVAAHSFHEALDLMTSTEPAALVTSVELGPYNGLHLLVRSSMQMPATRVVVIGPASHAVESEALGLGAAVYLPRPVALSDLVSRMDTLVPPAGYTPAPDASVGVARSA